MMGLTYKARQQIKEKPLLIVFPERVGFAVMISPAKGHPFKISDTPQPAGQF